MTTKAHAIANQRNALRSTGPRTTEGRAVASRNALTLGLWAREVLIPGDDPDEFEEFRTALLASLAPVAALESWYAYEIVVHAWRLRRVWRVEAEILAHQLSIDPDATTTLGRAYLATCRGTDALSKLARDEARIARAHTRALHELQRLQAARAGVAVTPPLVADVDLNIHTDQHDRLGSLIEPATGRAGARADAKAGAEATR